MGTDSIPDQAAIYGELAAQGAVRSDHHEEAEKARRAAAACGRMPAP